MYQALYRTYRPASFDDVVGQRAVTETLRRQVAEGRLSHAYLFTGTRGTGKTTCARILAKAVNCQHPVNGNPCNTCPACRGIDEGTILDVLEIDAASNSGVDHIRSLREDAVYAPAEVKRRVFIIDEVHMLSTAAFNALLKIIEEPPEHLMFILATTELQKVPATILSRCQRYSFRRLQSSDIEARLKYVALQEHLSLADDAGRLLAQLADGGMRDALSLLDQCAGVSDRLTAESVYAALGLAGEQRSAAILRAVADHDAAAALTMLSDLYSAGKDLAALLSELTSLSRDLLIRRTIPGASSLLSGLCSESEAAALAARFTPAELLRITSLLQQTASGFARSANRRIDAELCLLRMCDPSLSLEAEALDARLSRVEEQLRSGVVPAAQPAAPAQPAPAGDTPPWDDDGPPPIWEQEPPPPPDDRYAPPEPPAPAASPASGSLPVGFWADFIAAVRPALSPMVRGFFAASGPVTAELEGDALTLFCASDMVKRMVDRPEVCTLAGQKAGALLGKPVQVRVALAGAGSKSDAFGQLISRAKGLDNVTIK